MICLSLVATTIAQNLRAVALYAPDIDLVELRADFLLAEEREQIDRFPAALPAAADGAPLPAILTIRTPEDGGHWNESEAERRRLLLHGLRGGGYRYVDLEARLRGDDGDLVAAAAAAGTTVIRSIHDFNGVPAGLTEFLGGPAADADTVSLAASDGAASEGGAAEGRGSPGGSGTPDVADAVSLAAVSRASDLAAVAATEIPKAAVTPRSTAELVAFIRSLGSLDERPRIVVAMGAVGFPVRVLARRLGSILTFCSPGSGDNVTAAPGHVDPRTMSTLYRYRQIGAGTAVFGVIGNPIMHSRSPQYHNRRFAEDGIDAVYLPFEVDDVDAFVELADLLPIHGFSVTLPHKRDVIRHLANADAAVTAVGACNTVVGPPGARSGYNTDVEGFLAPLREVFGASGLRGKAATVVGAGGAARAVLFGLLSEGVSVLIVNRTVERAEVLAREFAGIADSEGVALEATRLGPAAQKKIRQFSDIIVQTTSVGMEPEVDADPLKHYPFHGGEVACDIVYTPPVTRILQRAAAAGCRTLPGTHMFDAQAEAQYRRYRQIATEITSR